MPGFFSNLWGTAKKNPWTTAGVVLPAATGLASHVMARYEADQHAESEAQAKADAYKRMLSLHPHLKGTPETARLYDSIYTVTPTFAKDPLVAGAMMDRIHADRTYGSTSHQGLLGIIREFGGAENSIPAPAPVSHVWGGESGLIHSLGGLASKTVEGIGNATIDARGREVDARDARLTEKADRAKEVLRLRDETSRSARTEANLMSRQARELMDKATEKKREVQAALADAKLKLHQAATGPAIQQDALKRYRAAAIAGRAVRAAGADLAQGSRAVAQSQKDIEQRTKELEQREAKLWLASNKARRDKIQRDGEWARGKTSALAPLRAKVAAARANTLHGMLRTLRV